MKACSKCGEHKPLSDFYRQAGCRDGVRPNCIACVKAYRRMNADRIAIASKARRLKDPEKIAATKRRYREANPDSVKEARRAAYEKNRLKENALARAYKAKHKERLAFLAAEKLKADPSKNRYARSLRRAVEKRARPAWSNKEKMQEIYFAADFLGMVTGNWYHVDHIVPLQGKTVCGLHCEANLQVILGSENQSKSNRFWPDMPGQI